MGAEIVRVSDDLPLEVIVASVEDHARLTPEQRARAGYDPGFVELDLLLFDEGREEAFEHAFLTVTIDANLRADWIDFVGPPVKAVAPPFSLEELLEIESSPPGRVIWGLGDPNEPSDLMYAAEDDDGESVEEEPDVTYLRAVVRADQLTTELIERAVHAAIRGWRPYLTAGEYNWSHPVTPEYLEAQVENLVLKRGLAAAVTREDYLAARGRADAHWSEAVADHVIALTREARIDLESLYGTFEERHRDFVDRVIAGDAEVMDRFEPAAAGTEQGAQAGPELYKTIAEPWHLSGLLAHAQHLQGESGLPIEAALEWLRRRGR